MPVLKCMPLSRIVYWIAASAIFLINIMAIYVHVAAGAALDLSLQMSDIFGPTMTRYVPAWQQLRPVMEAHGYGYRVPIVLNVILWNFLVYIPSLILCVLAVLYDFSLDGENGAHVSIQLGGRLNRDPVLMCFVGFI